MYEKCKRQELDSQRADAIVLANTLVCTSPYADSNKARKDWDKFIKSLTWEELEKKGKDLTVGGVRSMLLGAGIPMKKKKGDK